GHQRHVDDAAAELGFGFGMLFRGQGAQRTVLVAAADGDAEDGHAGGARLVDQAVRVTTAEQFAEQDEYVTLAEQVRVGDVSQGFVFGHIIRYLYKKDWGSGRAGRLL